MKDSDKERLKLASSVISDLINKASSDICKAIDTPLDLAREAAGIVGAYSLMQKIAANFILGASMFFAFMRDDRPDTNDDDDVLWVCLMSYEAGRKDAVETGFISRAQDSFYKIKGRYHNIPEFLRDIKPRDLNGDKNLH